MRGTDDGRDWIRIAETQSGVVSHRQLRASGLSAKQIKALRRGGVTQPTSALGVHRVAGSGRGWRQDLWIALLAGPEATLVSHRSAAALRGLLAPPAQPEVTVPRGASGRFGAAVVHHATVAPADRSRSDGFDTTSVGRTIVDCAAVLNQQSLNSLVDAAFGRNLCSYERVVEARERAGRVRGGARLTEALAPYAAGAEPGSVAAARVLRRIYDWGLPLPLCEYQINDAHGGFIAKVDFIWRPWWLILEYDGDEFHGPRRWAIDDRLEDEIEALGFRLERADRGDLRPSSTRLFDLLGGILLHPPTGPWPVRRQPGTPQAA